MAESYYKETVPPFLCSFDWEQSEDFQVKVNQIFSKIKVLVCLCSSTYTSIFILRMTVPF